MNDKRMLFLPPTTYVFGRAGAGKGYVGEILARRGGGYCYDLDQDLTEEYSQAILEKRLFTDGMRDRFFAVVCRRIAELQEIHPKLILTQATYKARHRELLRTAYPSMLFCYVTAPVHLIVERLSRHPRGAITAEYAERMAEGFEDPYSRNETVIGIENDADEERVVDQWLSAFGAKK